MEKAGSYPCPNCGYDPKAQPGQSYALRPGTILNGKYVVGTPLGQGGFGITYIGWNLVLDRKVAIKEYFPTGQVSRNVSFTNDLQWYTTAQARAALEQGLVSFQKEARKMALVSGIPQVVDVLDVFEENQTAYIVMDFIAGQTLKDRLAKTGPLPWEQAKAIFLPVIEAMDKVHGQGLIHRDLSPDNLMLLPDGSVKILDLGAAKDLNVNSGASSMQVAKSGFSPLEQYTQRGGSGSWTDVYAMAATMYYSLTGVLPPAAVDRVANDPLRWDLPQLTALPGYVLAALKRAMGLLQDQRTQTMAEFLSQLKPRESKPAPKPETKKSSPTLSPAQLVLLVLAVLWALIAGWSFLSRETKSAQGGKPTQAVSQSEPAVTDASDLPLQDKAIPSSLRQHTDTRPGNFDDDSEYAELLRSCTRETYTYSDGGTLDMYFDSADQERCRIYTDDSGQRQMIFTAEYTASGKYQESRFYDGEGLLQRLDLNEFNDQDNLTWKRTYDGSGKLDRLMEWEYDSEGRTASYREWSHSGKALEYGVYSYNTDKSGNGLYVSKEYDGTTRRNVINSQGNTLTYEAYDAKGTREYRGEYTYNSQGQTMSLTYYSGNNQEPGSLEEYVYSGDLKIQKTYHSYYSGKDNVTVYTLLYGPHSTFVGEKSDTQLKEYVCTIAGNYQKLTTQYIEESYCSHSVSSYDCMGKYLSYTEYRKDGSLSYMTQNHYDEEGLSLGRTSTSYNSDGGYSITEYDNDNHETGRKSYDADGALKSWTEYTYEDSQKWERTYDASGVLTVCRQTRYNGNGDVLEELTTDGSGELNYKYEYQYDTNGAKTGRIYTYVSSYDNSRRITTYDANDNEVSQKVYSADGTLTEWTDYVYADNEKRENTYDADGTLTSYVIFRYDDAGNRLSDETYNADGQLSYKTEYHYDASGKESGSTFIFCSPYDGSTTVTERDANYNALSEKVYNADGSLRERTTYTYTANSKVGKTYDASGKLTSESNYFYDANGNHTGHIDTKYHSDGSKTVREYGSDYNRISTKTYDASGNLIKTE